MADSPKKRRMLLRLPQGVSVDNIRSAEDVMEERLAELSEELPSFAEEKKGPSEETYDRLPDEYVEALSDSWPKSCNLRCWSCGFTFQGPPCFIPVSMREVEAPDPDTGHVHPTVAFRRMGVTCTFNCAATCISNRLRGEKERQARELLLHLYHSMHGERPARIVEAPDRTELQAYGGSLSDKEFWEKLHRLDPKHGLPSYKTVIAPPREGFHTAWEAGELAPPLPAEEVLSAEEARPGAPAGSAADAAGSDADFEEISRILNS